MRWVLWEVMDERMIELWGEKRRLKGRRRVGWDEKEVEDCGVRSWWGRAKKTAAKKINSQFK